LYVVLGDFGLLDSKEFRGKLLREVLGRASPQERQRYSEIQQRKNELSQRMQAIGAAQEALNQKDRQNVFPEKPRPANTANSRQAKAAAENAARKQYRDALEAYKTQNAAILAERVRLMGEFLGLVAEWDGLEEMEKWLLVSAAVRNQSSLLGFMGGGEK